MKSHKVKYNRQEYREEYLKSDEWKSLRNIVMNSKPLCQCCSKTASDVHHLVYRNLVDIKITDLLPVCRSCHDTIHKAIDCQYISQNPNDIDSIRENTLGILNDEKYNEWKEWYNTKHYISDDEIKIISELQSFVIKKISALARKNIWYNNLSEIKFTGSQILKIRKIIETALYRRKNKIDRNQRGAGFGKKFGLMQSNTNHHKDRFTNSIKRH
jgi:hypothetical protein